MKKNIEKITYKSISEKAMPPEKKEQCKDDWFGFYVGRKITYLMTIPFLHTKLAPNHITFASIAMLVIGFLVNCFAYTKWIMLISWFLYFMWSLLDGVDGNMARYRSQFSRLGDIYDTMGGYAAYGLIYFGMGIGAFFNGGILRMIPGEYFIILGALSSLSAIFPRLIYQKIKASFPGEEKADEVRKNKSLIRKLEMNITSVVGGTMIFSLIAICMDMLDIFTVVYAFLNVMKMILSLRIIFKDMEK